MLRSTLLTCALLASTATTASASDALPTAIACYQTNTNAKDIDAYLSCFTPDAEMIDVSRTFSGHEAIRTWAMREVIPKGDAFTHRKILDSKPGYAQTEVQWLSWVVHYFYWWNDDGKITKMSLQYAN